MTPQIASPRLWRDHPASRLDRLQQAWLCQPGALTAGLRKLGTVRLFVRHETVLALPPDWAQEAGLPAGASALSGAGTSDFCLQAFSHTS